MKKKIIIPLIVVLTIILIVSGYVVSKKLHNKEIQKLNQDTKISSTTNEEKDIENLNLEETDDSKLENEVDNNSNEIENKENQIVILIAINHLVVILVKIQLQIIM